MKRCLLLSALLCLFSITHMYAETTTPSITLTSTKTDVIEMKFGCRTAHTIHIDWGDGKLVETVEIADSATVYPKASSATIYPTAVTGTPVNGGKIKIYAIVIFIISALIGIGFCITSISVSSSMFFDDKETGIVIGVLAIIVFLIRLRRAY